METSEGSNGCAAAGDCAKTAQEIVKPIKKLILIEILKY
jgi:hypothetical protein